MRISKYGSGLRIECDHYRFDLVPLPRTSYLLFKDSGRIFGFIAGGDCGKTGCDSRTTASGEWRILRQDAASILLAREENAVGWEKKEFFIFCEENSIEFHHRLEGHGELEDVRFFRQTFRDTEYGFAGDIDEVYSTAPNFREKYYYHPTEHVVISHGNDMGPDTGCHALASVPHVMALHDRRDTAYLSAGAAAAPGQYDWDDFEWNPPVKHPPTDYDGDSRFAGGFAVRYSGKKTVNGIWESPRLIFTFAGSEQDVLAGFLEHAYRKDFLPRPAPRKIETWWTEPIYCTWHDQCALARKEVADYHIPGPSAGEFCTEELTERWLELLVRHHAKPGIVILDDKWQKSLVSAEPDTSKWPDLRGWIDRCHRRGIKVFLWYPAWHNQDIPQEEAITQNGVPVCGDITNPVHEKRFRTMIHTYFSPEPGCLNADGVKVDGLLGLPTGRGLFNHANLWGLELQKYFLEVLCDEAKKARPDVCVSTFAVHPYLAACTDMLRLGDMYSGRLTADNSMRLRQALCAAAMPFTPVDTDGQFAFHPLSDYIGVLAEQAEIGIPTIYNAEYLRRNRFFLDPQYSTLTEQDYAAIAEVFSRYRAKMNRKTTAGKN